MDMVEQVARALIRARGAAIVASDENWPPTVAHYRKMCAKYPDYVSANSLVNDAFRDARVAVEVVLSQRAP